MKFSFHHPLFEAAMIAAVVGLMLAVFHFIPEPIEPPAPVCWAIVRDGQVLARSAGRTCEFHDRRPIEHRLVCLTWSPEPDCNGREPGVYSGHRR